MGSSSPIESSAACSSPVIATRISSSGILVTTLLMEYWGLSVFPSGYKWGSRGNDWPGLPRGLPSGHRPIDGATGENSPIRIGSVLPPPGPLPTSFFFSSLLSVLHNFVFTSSELIHSETIGERLPGVLRSFRSSKAPIHAYLPIPHYLDPARTTLDNV
ncbi:hypothetical protein BDV37DRAFT_39209 [Aspergillus pseudonomiae]|uniref:Uncharacterized protein n=1 Tax=Aspergillus pseudonomiae TaxID=1506151 RepID=A0A5N7DNC7_9EURO|nr:uncharacterized protein BDV37DRAFT_39209 [Aspergillus pseudonomiae]KAE8406988.1 hypothetical protein BDV37DRAFT_39209 [Aspergillus pseudonomiae]